MGWWRDRRGTAGLGLFALSLQLFLSFGHIHLDGLHLGTHLTAPLASCGATRQAVGEEARSGAGQDQVPGRLPDDDCPICQAMHMAAAVVLPTPPAVPLPHDFGALPAAEVLAQVSVQSRRHVLFQTRAPPIV